MPLLPMLPAIIRPAPQAAPVAVTPYAYSRPLKLRAVTPSATAIPNNGKLELTLDFAATYNNPFDPDEIDVSAEFTSPEKSLVHVNGFLDQPYTRRLDGNNEIITPAGKPVWKIRFAPTMPGVWQYSVTLRDKSGTARTPKNASFTVTPSANAGFVRRSRKNPAVFAFSKGRVAEEKPFFAIGENVGWAGTRGTYDYDDWLPALHKGGGNWARVWMSPWNGAIEWTATGGNDWRRGNYPGLGVYSLDNAWKIDQILDIAAKNDIYVQLCFGTYGEFATGGYFNEGLWKANPYNAANGGPCVKPEDFWTNPTARKLYRRRLRYLAARYGWRTHIAAWEFWNETNPPAAWVEEMAKSLKHNSVTGTPGFDAQAHLIGTSYGNDAIWKIPAIDFTQTHHYGTGDVADHALVLHGDAEQFAPYGKPHLMAEFGIDWRDSDSKYDPDDKAINFHNGLWAGALSGDAGGGMLWWWDNYVAPKNLYGQFTGLRKFADAVPWTSGAWTPLRFDPPTVSDGPETFGDLALPATSGWGKSPATEFSITPQGLAGAPLLPQYLYSVGKAEFRTTPTFHVRYDKPGRFLVGINEVSDSANLQIRLDDKIVLDQPLEAKPPADKSRKPAYETTVFQPEYKSYRAAYHKEYGIDVPAGAHTITLDNTSGDWISLSGITLTGYRSNRYPSLNLYGLMQTNRAVLWAQNAAHTWKNAFEKRGIGAIRNADVTLRGLKDGRYALTWWDTTTGDITKRETVAAAGGAVTLHLPDVAADVAAQIAPGP